MSTKTYRLSLSRAHKVAEGIKREIRRVSSDLVEKAQPVPVYDQGEISQVESRLEKVRVTKAFLSQLHQVRSLVRREIAKKNSEIGLHEYLTHEKDINEENSQLSQLRVQLRHLNGDAHAKENIEALLLRQVVNNTNVVSAKTRVLDDDFYADLEEQIRGLQSLSSAISYQIADLNASNHIEVPIPEEVAKLIGIV